MRWTLLVALLPALAFASEECVTQLGGKCRPTCAPDEKAEQGAFLDCTEKEKCCVPGQAQRSPAAPPVVVIKQMAFSPGEMKVKAGTEVAWRNDDGSPHILVADDGSFSSPTLEQGGVFKKLFTKPGSYGYSCEMHPFMSGKIVVE